jgi:hypothetical protein
MKWRISLITLGIALAAMTASASDFGVHGGYYWGDLKQWAVGVDAQWPIGPVAISPNIDYSRKEGLSWWFASGDIDLRFSPTGGPAFWVGAGPTYGRVGTSAFATGAFEHDSEWGWDVNAGAGFGAMGGVRPYVSARYIKIKDFRSTGGFVGLRF